MSKRASFRKTGGKRGIKTSPDDLNIKEQIFVREYLKDENGTRAAIAAGYSRKTAPQAASRLLKSVKVQAELVKVTTKLCDDLEISEKRILWELARMAFYDPRKIFDADGRIKPITELDDDTAMAIAGLETAHKVVGDEADGCVVFTKVKLADKRANCELLGRKLKMWTDKIDHGGRMTLEELVCGE
jgi:phage terminase small subunit